MNCGVLMDRLQAVFPCGLNEMRYQVSHIVVVIENDEALDFGMFVEPRLYIVAANAADIRSFAG